MGFYKDVFVKYPRKFLSIFLGFYIFSLSLWLLKILLVELYFKKKIKINLKHLTVLNIQ